MCLYNAKRILPEGDIKCYKVLLRHKATGRLFSPYYRATEWRIGETISIDADDAELIDDSFLNCNDVYGLAFHTLSKEDDAWGYRSELMMEPIVRKGTHELVIVECTIPHGSRYVYEGDVPYYIHIGKGYGSQKLRVDRIIEEEKE